MSCKSFFDRYCLEHNITTTSSNALSNNKFHNSPEKIVMIYELLSASIERLNQACERMGITVNSAIAQYDHLRLQREINHMAFLMRIQNKNSELAKVASITNNKDNTSKGVAIV